MRKTPIHLASTVALFALSMALALPAMADRVRVDAKVTKVVTEKKLVVAVAKGDFRGRWSLEMKRSAGEVKMGDKAVISGDRGVFEARKGEVKVRFERSVGLKGPDLVGIIGWLGSLE